MKILIVHGEGLGNIVQILPLVATLEMKGHEVDLMLSNSSFDFPDGILDMNVFRNGDKLEKKYDGRIETVWATVHGHDYTDIRLLNSLDRQQMRLDMSEVNVYLNAAREFGIKEKDFVYDCKDLMAVEPKGDFDVVFSDGYNWKMGDLWKAKSWRGHESLVEMLDEQGMRSCSIGSDREYVEGTENMTGASLRDSLALIRGARMVVSNDSGFYHCACAMGIPVAVMFTFTSVTKNRDAVFHSSSEALGVDMSCRQNCHRDKIWRGCSDQHCRNMDSGDVFRKVMTVLEGEEDECKCK